MSDENQKPTPPPARFAGDLPGTRGGGAPPPKPSVLSDVAALLTGLKTTLPETFRRVVTTMYTKEKLLEPLPPEVQARIDANPASPPHPAPQAAPTSPHGGEVSKP